jgi:hypothetical protein
MKQAERAQENKLLAKAALVAEEMEARPNGILNVS